VCLVARNLVASDETVHTVHAEGGTGFAVVADVTSADHCSLVVARTLAEYGTVDVLVNSVGIVGPAARIGDADEGDWDRVMRVNVTSVVLMCRAALPALLDGGGAIVNVSSTASVMSSGDTPAYGASKAAMNRLTAELAIAYGPEGVRANAVAPGVISTPLLEALAPAAGRAGTILRSSAPSAHHGTAWDVGWAVVYLASDEAAFVNGACLRVDGGLSEISPFKAHQRLSEG
jgi:NAD(P)-dependent dehydrogenase (short-subunit alcohol dehydrogenase family)